MSMSELDVRDLRGRIRRIILATFVAATVARAAIAAVDELTGQRAAHLIRGEPGLVTIAVFAGSVFAIAWAITCAAATAVSRGRSRRAAPLPVARALRVAPASTP
jgi:hypothetical protein